MSEIFGTPEVLTNNKNLKTQKGKCPFYPIKQTPEKKYLRGLITIGGAKLNNCCQETHERVLTATEKQFARDGYIYMESGTANAERATFKACQCGDQNKMTNQFQKTDGRTNKTEETLSPISAEEVQKRTNERNNDPTWQMVQKTMSI